MVVEELRHVAAGRARVAKGSWIGREAGRELPARAPYFGYPKSGGPIDGGFADARSTQYLAVVIDGESVVGVGRRRRGAVVKKGARIGV